VELIVPVGPDEPRFAGGELVERSLQIRERSKLLRRPSCRLVLLDASVPALPRRLKPLNGLFAAPAVGCHSCLLPLGTEPRVRRGDDPANDCLPLTLATGIGARDECSEGMGFFEELARKPPGSWSGRGARGKGRFIYNMGFNEAARVRLFRRRWRDDDKLVFTRATVCLANGCHTGGYRCTDAGWTECTADCTAPPRK
jgi:hypothetical protein